MSNTMLLNLLRQQHQQNTGYGVVGGAKARKDPELLTSPYQRKLYELELGGRTRKQAIEEYSRLNPPKKAYVKKPKKSSEQRTLMNTKKERAKLIKTLISAKKGYSLCTDTVKGLKGSDIKVLQYKVAQLEQALENIILDAN